MNLIEPTKPFHMGPLGYVRDAEGRDVLCCPAPGCSRLWSGYYPPARKAKCPDCGTLWRDMGHVDPVRVDHLIKGRDL